MAKLAALIDNINNINTIADSEEDVVGGFVLANGSMSTSTSGEGAIRQKMIENDLVDCMIALPGQLFYTTQIPVCLWFLTKSKKARTISRLGDSPGSATKKTGAIAQTAHEITFRKRIAETLFIDARNRGTMLDRTHKAVWAIAPVPPPKNRGYRPNGSRNHVPKTHRRNPIHRRAESWVVVT